MTSIKPVLNYRPNKEGRHTLLLQIVHNRRRGVIFSKYRLLPQEFDKQKSSVVALSRSRADLTRSREINDFISTQTEELHRIISELEATGMPFVPTDITAAYRHHSDRRFIHAYIEGLIAELEQEGRHGTARTYRSTLSAFEKFTNNDKRRFDELDASKLADFERHLKRIPIKRNTISFYMRILRAIYNKAKRDRIVEGADNPFDIVSFREDKTRKLAVSQDVLRQIMLAKHLPSNLELARDLFLFSFYARGMSFVDMSYLRREQLTDNTLCYNRHKTGQPFSVRITSSMQQIISHYNNKGPWVFPLMVDDHAQPLVPHANESQTEFNYRLHRCYKKSLSLCTQHLGRLSDKLGLECKLSFNVARHSWASLARSRGIPIAVISGGLGHTSEKTTTIYLAELDARKLDEANDIITKL